MRRLAVVIACGIALALPMAGQGVAADTWGGCQGNTCTVSIDKIATIILTQDGHPIPLNLSNVDVTVPACWLAPTFTQAQMVALTSALALYAQSAPAAQRQQLQRYLQEVTANTSTNGTWWTGQYLDTPAGLACLANLPLWVWVPTGQVPPAADNPLTPLQLAELAEAALRVPKLAITLNPRGKTYVNLPTFLWTGNPALITVTATIPNYMSVTVWARPAQPLILPGTSAATAYSACGPKGSHYTALSPQVTGAGPGSRPDCGVVYQAASTSAPQGYSLQVTVPWNVTWSGAGVLPGPRPSQTAAVLVPVEEIQSLNTAPPGP